MTCSSLNQSSNRYRVLAASLPPYNQCKKRIAELICIAAAVWMLAGCHTTTNKSSEINSGLSETTVSSSVMTRPLISSQSPVEKYGSKKNVMRFHCGSARKYWLSIRLKQRRTPTDPMTTQTPVLRTPTSAKMPHQGIGRVGGTRSLSVNIFRISLQKTAY